MITIVVAMGKNREIGADNQLLWHLPKDLKHFKELTSGHPIIMGRKTYESIGKPLPNRTNIVISRKNDWFEEGILIVGSIDLADQLEVTLVDAELKADTFFPKIDEKKWLKTNEVTHQKDEKNQFDFSFQTFERILEK